MTLCLKPVVRDLLRIAWRTVGSIVTRVVADAQAATGRFANLRRIGIDEISYKRGNKYLTVVGFEPGQDRTGRAKGSWAER